MIEIWDDPDYDYDLAREEDLAARMFYWLEGWEKLWPYDKRPEWLRVKYP